MAKEELNRAQRRLQQRKAQAHTPNFWDSTVNRAIVIGLAVAFFGVIVYGLLPKSTQTAANTNTPAAPPATNTTKPAQQPTTPPPTPATPPATNAKVETTEVKAGTGAEVKSGDSVSVLYTGTLDNGQKFDSTSDHGGTPYTFTVGQAGTIQGFSQGVLGMKQGGKRKVTIPPALGYGAAGNGPKVPPNSTLHFDMEVVKIEPKS